MNTLAQIELHLNWREKLVYLPPVLLHLVPAMYSFFSQPHTSRLAFEFDTQKVLLQVGEPESIDSLMQGNLDADFVQAARARPLSAKDNLTSAAGPRRRAWME